MDAFRSVAFPVVCEPKKGKLNHEEFIAENKNKNKL